MSTSANQKDVWFFADVVLLKLRSPGTWALIRQTDPHWGPPQWRTLGNWFYRFIGREPTAGDNQVTRWASSYNALFLWRREWVCARSFRSIHVIKLITHPKVFTFFDISFSPNKGHEDEVETGSLQKHRPSLKVKRPRDSGRRGSGWVETLSQKPHHPMLKSITKTTLYCFRVLWWSNTRVPRAVYLSN